MTKNSADADVNVGVNYELIVGKDYNEDWGIITTYGIKAIIQNEYPFPNFYLTIENISSNLDFVNEMITTLKRYKVSYIHFEEIVYDLIIAE